MGELKKKFVESLEGFEYVLLYTLCALMVIPVFCLVILCVGKIVTAVLSMLVTLVVATWPLLTLIALNVAYIKRRELRVLAGVCYTRVAAFVGRQRDAVRAKVAAKWSAMKLGLAARLLRSESDVEEIVEVLDLRTRREVESGRFLRRA